MNYDILAGTHVFNHFSGELPDAVSILERNYPTYSFSLSTGLLTISLIDRQKNDPLDLKIDKLEIHHLDVPNAVRKVCDHFPGRLDYPRAQIGPSQYYEGVIDATLDGMTVREALNEIVRVGGRALWLRYYDDPNTIFWVSLDSRPRNRSGKLEVNKQKQDQR
jgi:hypothetical protein